MIADTSPERLQELKALAEKATPGPYVATSGCRVVTKGGSPLRLADCLVDVMIGADQGHKNSAYIAAMSPEQCIAMCERLLRLERILESVEGEFGPYYD